MERTPGTSPVSRITFGPMQVDWEERLDFKKMRTERLQRARNAMAKADMDGRHIRVVKKSPTSKIDLAVCLSMADYEAMRLNL